MISHDIRGEVEPENTHLGKELTFTGNTIRHNNVERTDAVRCNEKQTITKFVHDNQNGVVLLDGIEYLVSNNDFNKVLRMVDQVNDHILQSTSRLILPVDPRAFDQKELALLERSMEKVQAGGP